ncbi:MAG: phytoene/squalene synthase family protein [Betaproteobacteria bacterium]|jgi:phytoene synthase
MMQGENQAEDIETCERLMRGGSRSFFAASLVLPRRVRAPATALYAFCRIADDAIDLNDDRPRALAHLQERLARAYEARPMPFPADRAFAAVVARHGIPRALPEALLDGFRWDSEGRQYETIADVHAYGARVAGTVGAMMALIMGVRAAGPLARACELGVAMQLTNIARDVGEDAAAGRLYLPRAWMREASIDPDAWLRSPVFDARVARVVARLLAEADRLYERAGEGIGSLPRDCRPAIQAARLVYAEIGREVERAGCDSVSRRAVVPAARKVTLMARALGAILSVSLPGDRAQAPALPAVQALVDAAATPATAKRFARASLPRRSFDEKVAWVVDLFTRLAERDRTVAVFGRSRS